VDPVIASAALVKAVDAAAPAAGELSVGLLQKVLGPSADEIGESLRRWTAFRVGNTARIVKGAEAKALARGRKGIPAARLAHRLLEDGSFCDDTVMVEYLSGVLAGGRTPDGRDDRATVWSARVTGMSALQVRAHYMFYRAWYEGLAGRDNIFLGQGVSRNRCVMIVDEESFREALLPPEDMRSDAMWRHVILGLIDHHLLSSEWFFGNDVGSKFPTGSIDVGAEVRVSLQGLELWGWAHGMPGMGPVEFLTEDFESENLEEIPRFKAEFPRLELPEVAPQEQDKLQAEELPGRA
jgi:hypothetical protein